MKNNVIIVGAPSLPTSEAMLAAARGCAAPGVESDLQYMLRRMRELKISESKQHNESSSATTPSKP